MAAMLGSVSSLERLGATAILPHRDTPGWRMGLSAKKAAKEYNKEH